MSARIKPAKIKASHGSSRSKVVPKATKGLPVNTSPEISVYVPPPALMGFVVPRSQILENVKFDPSKPFCCRNGTRASARLSTGIDRLSIGEMCALTGVICPDTPASWGLDGRILFGTLRSAWDLVNYKWTMPKPPTGYKWRRGEFEEIELPPGYRPTLEGEPIVPTDEVKKASADPSEEWIPAAKSLPFDTPSKDYYKIRTNRALPDYAVEDVSPVSSWNRASGASIIFRAEIVGQQAFERLRHAVAAGNLEAAQEANATLMAIEAAAAVDATKWKLALTNNAGNEPEHPAYQTFKIRNAENLLTGKTFTRWSQHLVDIVIRASEGPELDISDVYSPVEMCGAVAKATDDQRAEALLKTFGVLE